MRQASQVNQTELGEQFRRDTEQELSTLLRDGIDVHAEYCRLVWQLHIACESDGAATAPDTVNVVQAA